MPGRFEKHSEAIFNAGEAKPLNIAVEKKPMFFD
jgi:hypothetical protein